MKRLLLSICLTLVFAGAAHAQLPKVYDEQVDPIAQINRAVAEAHRTGRNVVCQVGGNWCAWCLRFADFIRKDTAVAKVIADNYVYIHVNYPGKGTAEKVMARLDNPKRFGFPVLVVLNGEGKVIHTQDSSFLEEGKSYNSKRVLRFFKCWTPQAVKGEK